MYENLYKIWWSIVLTVVFVAGSDLETIPDCVNCKNDKSELGEYLKSQKIAHRLEFIKQQLINNLHVKSTPQETPKFDSLPDFLVQKLVYDDATNRPNDNVVDGTGDDQNNRQMVLFVEQENVTCISNNKRGICLNFKLSDEILSTDLSSATIWFHQRSLPINNSGMHNFTIVDKTALLPKNRNPKNITMKYVADKDGWYQIDVTSLVKSWLPNNNNKKEYKHPVLMVSCDSCIGTEYATNVTWQSANKTSFLLLNTESEESARLKRGVECTPGKEECCREDLWVDFSSLGDDYRMILSPPKFNAYVCRGTCVLPGYETVQRPYAELLSVVKARRAHEFPLPSTCCTPTRFSNLNVLFASDSLTIQRSSIPNMVVETCGCV
ncbi:growth/differentiation factor 8-like [Planococcus citri]|uniref:growth/differentiation factor 8-like n=1 Tax=Planococcus citri TaxID=170843 RepID=UPI0031F856DF